MFATVIAATGLALAAPAVAAPVEAGDLAALQPDPAALNDMFAGPGLRNPSLTVTDSSTSLQNYVSTERACVGAVYPGTQSTYQGSSYRGIDIRTLTSDTTGPVRVRVTTAIAAFPTEEAATAFVSETGQAWQNCAGEQVNLTLAGQADEQWYVQTLSEAGDGFAVRTNRVSDHSTCSHVVTAKANASIEVLACTTGIMSDQAVRVADQVRAGITG
ncbi:sensor domain-containing protein [[Mycobacterium] nativiensis]|uniref:Sensor domain-containing protein n=1 Tax=[Mycobacterium] nativiensis TaxID=2855503 RepID=A0ABU5Y1N8_9MYCO|nr:sensor domain-containing protein [Mycolicibacter sp. MYC340]MEB3033967.1 sensor domain-containing protein [Mycolicibacter sp. MYC340]